MSAAGPGPGPGEDRDREPLTGDEVDDALRRRVRGGGDRSMQRMQALAAVVLVALFAVFALVISQGGTEPTAADGDGPVQGVEETTALLGGLPERDGVLGEPEAPLRLVEIVDLQCPACADHQLRVQPEVIARYVRPGRVQAQLVSIGLLGPDSERLRNVHERLSAKDRGWRFASLVLRNQGTPGTDWATDEYLRRIVAEIPGAGAADAAPTAEPAVERRVAETRRFTRRIADRMPTPFGTPAFAIGPADADPATFTPVTIAGDRSVLDALDAAITAAERRLQRR